MSMYINNGNVYNPSNLLLFVELDLSQILEDEIYFGFSTSTSDKTELNYIKY